MLAIDTTSIHGHLTEGVLLARGPVPSYRAHAIADLNRVVQEIHDTREGTRNVLLNAKAFGLARYIHAGSLDPDYAAARITAAAQAAGLDDDEIQATLNSAWR